MGLNPSLLYCIRFANDCLCSPWSVIFFLLYYFCIVVMTSSLLVRLLFHLSRSFPITSGQVAFVLDTFFVHYKKKEIEDVKVSEVPVSKQLQIDYENAFSIVCDICHFPSVFYYAASHTFVCSCCFEHSKKSDGLLHQHQARSILKM